MRHEHDKTSRFGAWVTEINSCFCGEKKQHTRSTQRPMRYPTATIPQYSSFTMGGTKLASIASEAATNDTS
jgi:hypothetical protein